jgi:uncharacterized membrane protein HdeD (DUF308 family)
MSMNDGSNRSRFMDTIKSALAPREPVKIDPGAPNPIPRTVKIAGWLSIAAGLLNFALGILTMVQRNPYVQGVMDNVAECKAQGIGVGAAVTTTDTSDFITMCKSLGDYTAAQYDSARSALLVTAAVLIVVGLAGAWAGWGVTRGARWARTLMTAIGALLLISTMLQLLASPLVLIAALLMLFGLALCYVGKGANYYIRAKAKGIK